MKHFHNLRKGLMILFTGLMLSSTISCNIQQKLQSTLNGLNYSKPLGKLKSPADSLVNSLAGSALMGIADSSHKALDKIFKNLNGNVDPELTKLIHAINTFGDTTNFQICKIGDNVTWQIGRFKGKIKAYGPMLDSLVSHLKGKVLNIPGLLVANALDTLKSTRSHAKLDSFVSHLLDANTKERLGFVVSGALKPTLDSLSSDVHQLVHKDVPFITRQALILVAGIGIVILAIMAFAWYERRKYMRLSEVLTSEINKMPGDKADAYDDLTHRIQFRAQDENLEPTLRKLLVKQGIN